MANLTLTAQIDHGRITVDEPEKLPAIGRALLTVLDSPTAIPDLEKIRSVLGTLRTELDGAAYERQVRAQWDEREREQRGNR
jgi:hypothetical protein